MVYVDPPYDNTIGTEGAYRHGVDRDALLDVLRVQRGRVAISGYGDEWDALGWERHEYETVSLLGDPAAKKGATHRGMLAQLCCARRA